MFVFVRVAHPTVLDKDLVPIKNERKKIERKIEGKKKLKKMKNRFKVNKLFLYVISNLFILFYIFYIKI